MPALPNQCHLDQSTKKWTLLDQTITGEQMYEIKTVDKEQVRIDLQKLKASGVDSIAVVLAHSYTASQQEIQVGQIAQELGIHTNNII